MSDTMGSLAATDEYDPFAAEKFVNPVVQSGMGALLAPRVRDENSPVEYTTASPLVNITTQDIADATDKAMAFSGGGLGIKAYHSSPHDFDRFDLSKIGSGEGAQVYGHGLYFAENPAVSGQGGQYWQQFAGRFGGPEGQAARRLEEAGFDREGLLKTLTEHLERARAEPTNKMYGDFAKQSHIDMLQKQYDLLASGKPVGPRTYEVNINADPAHFLDWDKALKDQPHLLDQLQSAGVSRSLLNEASGGDLYHKAAIDFHRPGLGHLDRALASEKFAEAGIPGIKYLDQGSRLPRSISDLEGRIAKANTELETWNRLPNDRLHPMMTQSLRDEIADLSGQLATAKATPQSSNYVVFDPNLIDIMKKYGIAGAAPVGMGALAAQDQYSNGGM